MAFSYLKPLGDFLWHVVLELDALTNTAEYM